MFIWLGLNLGETLRFQAEIALSVTFTLEPLRLLP